MSSEGDFHCHSNRSDGTSSPADLVAMAASHGVRVFALTDHDTLDGLDEARAAVAAHPGMAFVPGVEFGCYEPGTEVHILGLFVDPTDETFRTEIADAHRKRIERGEAITAALASLGVPVSWDRVREIAGEASVGRPHFARALIEAGHVADIDEAFERFLGRQSPAYIEGKRMYPQEAIDLIHGARGLAIFAHPPFTADYEHIAERLSAMGLDGMEVYYRHYAPDVVEALRALAERLGLIPSGGSDYHGLDREHEHEPGDFDMPREAVLRLLRVAGERGCASVPDVDLDAGSDAGPRTGARV